MTRKEQVRNYARTMVRRVLRTDDVGKFVRLRRLALEKAISRQPIPLPEFRTALGRLGFSRGRTVWVQSSWNEFYNINAKPSEIIGVMRDLLGPDGTLVMPAFPLEPDASKVLEIDTAPASTGLLTEVFRRTRDVERSIHLTSVCAAGPGAHYLVQDHHHDRFAWGEKTPFCRLVGQDARFVSFGLGRRPGHFTPLHSVECLLYDEVPFFRRVFDGTIAYTWRRRSGEEGRHEFMRRVGRIAPNRFGGVSPLTAMKASA